MHFGTVQSPYKGFFINLFFINIVPIGLFLIIYFLFAKINPSCTSAEKVYSAMIFGFGVGSLSNVALCVTGVMNDPFYMLCLRMENLFDNIGVLPFKNIVSDYLEDLKDYGIVFWIYLYNMLAYVFLAVFGYFKYFEFFK